MAHWNMHGLVFSMTKRLGRVSPWLAFLAGLMITGLGCLFAYHNGVASWTIPGSGLTLSGLLFIAVWAVVRAHRDAEMLNAKMTTSLQISEARSRKLAMVAARTKNCVFITDAQGRIEWINESFTQLTGYTIDDVSGKFPTEFLESSNCDPSGVKQLSQAIEHGKAFVGELVNRSKSGQLYWTDVDVQPVLDTSGTVTNFVCLENDITEHKQSEAVLEDYTHALESANNALEQYSAEAKAATEAKSSFLANMSHELRTPLTAILGFAEYLRQDGNMTHAPSSRIDAIDTILRNSDHLLRLINDLLDLSKIEAGRFEIECVPCAMLDILSRVHELMEPRTKSKGLTFSIRFLGPVPKDIVTDPTRIHQILLNLIGNSIKFTERGHVCLEVRLVAQEQTPRLEFAVIDTGIGMNEEQTAKLFQPFVQADQTISGRFGGTGLGLSVSRKFANLMGGDIRVMSVVGQGTTFVLELPAGVIEDAPMIDHFESTTTKVTTAPINVDDIKLSCHVLLAEDGHDNQRLISMILRKAGAEVTIVENGQLAVEAATKAWKDNAPFDLILMDMHMPILDGCEAVKQLRKANYPHPIIALTADAMQDDRKKYLAAGCDDYASKPIQRKALLTLVAKATQHPDTDDATADDATTDDATDDDAPDNDFSEDVSPDIATIA
jgi:PAS domain S-box-containing protein